MSFELPCADTFLADRCPAGTTTQFVVRMSDGRTFARDARTGAIFMRGGYILGPAATPIGFFRSIAGSTGTGFSNSPPPNLAPDPFAPPSIATVVSVDRAYAATLAGTDTIGSHRAYHLVLRPLGNPVKLPLRDVWIDRTSFAVAGLTYERRASADAPAGTVRYEFAPVGSPPYWIVVKISATLPVAAGTTPATPQATLDNVSFPSAEPPWMFDATLPR
ncbi:MAG TPA: hypothetical protein VGK84_12895 [Candidatus Tumulicola sp.]